MGANARLHVLSSSFEYALYSCQVKKKPKILKKCIDFDATQSVEHAPKHQPCLSVSSRHPKRKHAGGNSPSASKSVASKLSSIDLWPLRMLFYNLNQNKKDCITSNIKRSLLLLLFCSFIRPTGAAVLYISII